MKSYLGKIIQLTIFVLLAACLPQEKTTQCSAGQAYNATQRRCVTTQANSSESISISSVSPTSSYAISNSDPSITHSIIVNDPFSLGYSIKWNLKQPNGSTLLVGTGLSYTFVQSAFGTGSYILEAQLLDSAGSKVLDTRSWTINLTSQATPSISATTPNPFSTTTTSAATTITAALSNPDAISNVNYEWYVNGTVTTDTGTFSSTTATETFSFDPTSTAAYYAGAGTYALQLVLKENGSGLQYDSYTWTISNNIPGFATASLGTATGGTASGHTTPTTGSLITVIDQLDVFAGGFKSQATPTTLQDVDICLYVSDHTGVDGDNVYVDFLVNGAGVPSATGLQFTSSGAGGTICMGSAINAAGGTYYMDIPSTIQVESRSITAVVYDGFSGVTGQPSYNGGAEIARYNWTARVRQQNAAPVITIDTGNTTIGCTTSGTTSASGCSITQDQAVNIALTVSDDADGDGIQDYDPNSAADFQKFQVEFYLDGQLLDSTNPSSSTDCYHTFTDATPTQTTRYICSLTINSWDANGPVNPLTQSYTITAKVKDAQSPYAPATESDYSNEVSWTIPVGNVAYATDTLTLTPFGIVTGTDSVVTNTSATVVNDTAGTVAENDVVYFRVIVDDDQRDSHLIKIFRCDDGAVACNTPALIAQKQVNSIDATNPRETVIAHQISQDAVKNTLYADVIYKVVVYSDSNSSPPIESFDTLYIDVDNYNPIPVLGGTVNPSYNTIATPMIAFAGFPITIDSGTITDASLADGENLSYQWVYSTDGATYNAISGATSKNLIWSPGSSIDFDTNPTGQVNIKVKLCVGDDGYHNTTNAAFSPTNGNDCREAASDTNDWHFTVYSNIYMGSSLATENSAGQTAVWIDPSTKNPIVKYMAYVNTNKEIVVEKLVTTTTTGVKKGSTRQTTEEISHIIFNSTTDPFFGSNEVTNLSITGDATNKSLYIAYMAPVSSVDQVHIRRIDIREGKTGMTHPGVFGFDRGYDDMLDNFTPGPGLSEAMNGAGKLEITVNQSGDAQPLMSVGFLSLSSYGTVETLSIAAGDFCTGSCASTTATATEIANAINASTLQSLQGVIATSAGAVVTIEGVYEGDYLQVDIGATDIGDIMVNKTAGKWQLPLIDSDFTGTDKFKLSMYYGDLNTRLTNSSPVKTALDNTNVLPADEIANDIYESDPDADSSNTGNDNIIIATKNRDDNFISIYEFNYALTFQERNVDVFADANVTDIKLKVSQNTTNPAAYLMGRNLSDSFAYARIDHASGNFTLTSITPALDMDNDFTLIENGNATQFDITPGAEQYQLFMATTDNANNTAYIATINNATPTIDCSFANDQDLNKCMKLTGTTTPDTVFNLPIVLSDVLEDVTIGSAGATTNENVNDIMLVVFQVDDGGGISTVDALPYLGVINATGIDVTGDETNVGQYHNIPYVNN